jgi:hypothetical protein
MQEIKTLQNFAMQLQLFVIALLDGINFSVFDILVEKNL